MISKPSKIVTQFGKVRLCIPVIKSLTVRRFAKKVETFAGCPEEGM